MALKELNLIQKYGSGVRRAIEAFVAYGLPEPVFEAIQGGMAGTVFKQTEQEAPENAAVGVNEGASEGANGLLALIADQPSLRGSALAKLHGTSLRQKTWRVGSSNSKTKSRLNSGVLPKRAATIQKSAAGINEKRL